IACGRARSRLALAADVRVDFGRGRYPGPAGAVTTMNPLTRSLTRRSPTRVGGRGGGASPTLTPTRATGPGGRAWNDISPRREPRQVHHRPRRNRVERDAPRLGVEGQEPLVAVRLLPHVRRRALDAARVPHVRRQLGRDVVVAQRDVVPTRR